MTRSTISSGCEGADTEQPPPQPSPRSWGRELTRLAICDSPALKGRREEGEATRFFSSVVHRTAVGCAGASGSTAPALSSIDNVTPS